MCCKDDDELPQFRAQREEGLQRNSVELSRILYVVVVLLIAKRSTLLISPGITAVKIYNGRSRLRITVPIARSGPAVRPGPSPSTPSSASRRRLLAARIDQQQPAGATPPTRTYGTADDASSRRAATWRGPARRPGQPRARVSASVACWRPLAVRR